MKYSTMSRTSDRVSAVCTEHFQISSGPKEPLVFVSKEYGEPTHNFENYLESILFVVKCMQCFDGFFDLGCIFPLPWWTFIGAWRVLGSSVLEAGASSHGSPYLGRRRRVPGHKGVQGL